MFLFSVENFQLAVKNMDVDLNVILNMNLHNFFLRTSTTDVRFNVNLHAVNNILLFLFFFAHKVLFAGGPLKVRLRKSTFADRHMALCCKRSIWPSAKMRFGRLRK